MEMSPEINEIGAALAKAQKVMKGAKKDSANPFFKSKYADLSAVADACRDALTDNEIAVVQAPSSDGEGRVSVETMLVHSSGQWFRERLSVKPKDDGAQAVGSCISYLRRYSLAAFAGVAPEDDDAEAAEGRRKETKAASAQVLSPAGFNAWLDDLIDVADEGTAALEAAWKKSKPEFRTHLTTTANARWEAIKSSAATKNQKVPA